jgi:hypothetical protein
MKLGWLFSEKAVPFLYLILITTLFGLFVFWRHDVQLTKQLELAYKNPKVIREPVTTVSGPKRIKEHVVTTASGTTTDREIVIDSEIITDGGSTTEAKKPVEPPVQVMDRPNIIQVGALTDRTLVLEYTRLVKTWTLSAVVTNKEAHSYAGVLIGKRF